MKFLLFHIDIEGKCGWIIGGGGGVGGGGGANCPPSSYTYDRTLRPQNDI